MSIQMLSILLAAIILATSLVCSAQNASIGAIGPNIVINTLNGTGTVTIDGVVDIKEMAMRLINALTTSNQTAVGNCE
jgi:hypothetical protein